MSEGKEIYFHIGLGKTGTTFLQYRAFPYFEGFHYIQRTKFHKAKKIIADSNKKRFFLSFECDQQLYDVAQDWAKSFPKTTPIIVFREQSSWIASQYRRFLKNCHVRQFEELFSLDSDAGLFKKTDLDFLGMIEMLENTFGRKPIVLIYDDMRKNPQQFISNLATSMGSSIDLNKVDFSNKHSSYSEKQLKFLKIVSRYINLKKRIIFKNRTIEFFRKTIVNGTRYFILFIAKLVPNKLLDSAPLIPPKELESVREFYAQNWAEVVNRSKN